MSGEKQNLHDQYMKALAVIAETGLERPDEAPELSDDEKLKVIEIAKGLVGWWWHGPETKTTSCILCKGEFVGYGNNPDPLSTTGRCCDMCNSVRVIPARMAAWQ
eukprot:COSAG03_NODE_1919_length_3353_cov_32.836816_3_plen_105_part_00